MCIRDRFGRVFIVTNQQGIGKQLMSTDDLDAIHQLIKTEVKNAGGSIDRIYYAPQLASENSEMRKPSIGMAKSAKNDFPDIDLTKSIMIGDSLSDIQFAKNANMIPIWLSKNLTEETSNYIIQDLIEFDSVLCSMR